MGNRREKRKIEFHGEKGMAALTLMNRRNKRRIWGQDRALAI